MTDPNRAHRAEDDRILALLDDARAEARRILAERDHARRAALDDQLRAHLARLSPDELTALLARCDPDDLDTIDQLLAADGA